MEEQLYRFYNWRQCGSETDVLMWERHFPELASTLDILEELGCSTPGSDKYSHIMGTLERGVDAEVITYSEKSRVIQALSGQYGWM